MRQRGVVPAVQADAQWNAPGCPLIILRQQAQAGIEGEVMRGFNALPKRGAEVGGILLGSRSANGIIIEECAPIPCEHRFGPSYQLSESDRRGLEKSLEQVGSGAGSGSRPVGMYRSSTMPEFGVTAADEELFREYFGDPAQVLLWIKPRRLQPSEADFFLWRDGKLVEASSPQPFPFKKVLAPAAAAPSEPPPAAAERPRIVLPEHVRTRRIDDEDERLGGSRRLWIAWGLLALILAAIGGVLGYRALHSGPAGAPAASVRREPAAPPRVEAPPPVEPPPPAVATTPPPVVETIPPPPAQATPLPAQPEPRAETAVPAPAPVEPKPGRRRARAREAAADSPNRLLDRWTAALRSGNADAVAQCYAPRLVSYFTRRGATRAEVRGNVARMFRLDGSFQVLRLSDIRIVPDGRGRVVATFRKRWQTSRKYAGEERDRLTMVKSAAGWQIDSERELQVYWLHGR